MSNTFDLRKFLKDNKLTPSTKRLLSESYFDNYVAATGVENKVEIEGQKVEVRSIKARLSNDGYTGAIATYAQFENGKPLNAVELESLTDDYQELIQDKAQGMIREFRDYFGEEKIFDNIEDAKKEAQRISLEDNTAQHVEETEQSLYKLSDDYDKDHTVYSFENGRPLY